MTTLAARLLEIVRLIEISSGTQITLADGNSDMMNTRFIMLVNHGDLGRSDHGHA